MTVDIRAKIYCDLGEVISGGFSDDHAQGTGLIRTRGDITIKGLVRPSYGQLVQLGWKKDTTFSRIPRALRVLSFFADPFRRITTIQLGCKFTLFENKKPGSERDRYFYSKEDADNKDKPCGLYDVALLPISANEVAKRCLQSIGITGTPGLTNYYASDKFDLEAGYVSVLSDLLYAESKVGYMRADEVLEVVDLRKSPSVNKVTRAEDVIDIGPITGGEPPVDAVGVRYSYTRYKTPQTDSTPEDRWEVDEQIGELTKIQIPYNSNLDTFEAVYTPYTRTETTYDRFNRTTKVLTITENHVAQVNGSYVAKLLDSGTLYPGIKPLFFTVYEQTETYYDYERAAEDLQENPGETALECLDKTLAEKLFDPDRDGAWITSKTYEYVSPMQVAGTLGIEDYVFINPNNQAVTAVHPGTSATVLASYTEQTNSKVVTEELGSIFVGGVGQSKNISTVTKTVTKTTQARYKVQQGQQLYASRLLFMEAPSDLEYIIEEAGKLYNTQQSVSINTGVEANVLRRPDAEQIADYKNRKGIRNAEDTTETTFITGDENSGNSRIYDLPYAPDDQIRYLGGGIPGSWQIVQSDVKQKALDFARAQNRLNLGHRYGFSLQLTADTIPPYPLDGIAVEASGALALFRTNGTSWAFDSNGIVCNTDALYWAGLGNTDPGYQIWFQVQPGISLLPPVSPSVNPTPAPVNNLDVDPGFDPNAAVSATQDYGLITAATTATANWGSVTTAAGYPRYDWGAEDGWATVPYDLAPVYAEYLTDPALVPAYLEQVTQVFPVLLAAEYTRIDIVEIEVALDAAVINLRAIVPVFKPPITASLKVEATYNASFSDLYAVIRVESTVEKDPNLVVGVKYGYVLL